MGCRPSRRWRATRASDSTRTRATEPSPLRGKLFDEAGAPLTPSHATKSGRRYRYYISQAAITGSAGSTTSSPATKPWRLPAREIERASRGRGHGAARGSRGAGSPRSRGRDRGRADSRAASRRARLERSAARAREARRATSEEIAIGVDLSRLLGRDGRRGAPRDPGADPASRVRRCGIVIESGRDGSRAREPDAALIKAVVRARGWFEDLVNGRARSYDEIAKREGDHEALRRSPDAAGFPRTRHRRRDPRRSAARRSHAPRSLTKRTDLPLGWAEQKVLLGFD